MGRDQDMSADHGRRTLLAGDRALLVELADLDAALGYFTRLSQLQDSPDAIAGVTELLPAARTVLVNFEPWRITAEELISRLQGVEAAPTSSGDGSLITIEVIYDGEDLAEVAELLDVTTDDLISMHTGSEYRVAFAGFAPGFAYLSGGDRRLDVARRSTPRTRIPAGSVGLAGTFSGVYPRESPGGWQLIGRTLERMWQVDRDPPARLSPGDRVRFVAVTAAAEGTGDEQSTDQRSTDAQSTDAQSTQAQSTHAQSTDLDGDARPALIVRRPGLQTVLQDEGRPGLGGLGVSASGALDLPAAHLANRLVGNPSTDAVLEIPLGGFTAEARGPVVVAVTGAQAPVRVRRAEHTVDVDDQRPLALDDGDLLEIGTPTSGFRAVLAVRGGFSMDPVLGSLSTDTLAGLGPEQLQSGDLLGVGDDAGLDAVGMPAPWPVAAAEELIVPITLGPRDDWFEPGSIALLGGQDWTITEQADRVGIRLSGQTALSRAVTGELASEGTVTGSIQVPPSGQPTIFLADHPLTGGYPVIGVVDHAALPMLAQARPGVRIRFTHGRQESS